MRDHFDSVLTAEDLDRAADMILANWSGDIHERTAKLRAVRAMRREAERRRPRSKPAPVPVLEPLDLPESAVLQVAEALGLTAEAVRAEVARIVPAPEPVQRARA